MDKGIADLEMNLSHLENLELKGKNFITKNKEKTFFVGK